MRHLPPRPELSPQTLRRIESETLAIEAIKGFAEQAAGAANKYNNARSSQWFREAIDALKSMAGEGQRCMCCSGGEAAQVEHYRPKSTYPSQALLWANLLWICGVCNLTKADDFDENCQPVNPVDDYVWDYFFIDEFGNFCAKWSNATNSLNSRAVKTIQIYGLDRQTLQETRLARLNELKRFLDDSLVLKAQGQLSIVDLQLRALEFHASPLQPDVSDYFLNGPGSSEHPVEIYFSTADL